MRDRPFDRTVKIKPGEKLLLVDGDEELFLEQTKAGIKITDARGFSMPVQITSAVRMDCETVIVRRRT